MKGLIAFYILLYSTRQDWHIIQINDETVESYSDVVAAIGRAKEGKRDHSTFLFAVTAMALKVRDACTPMS